MQGSSSTGVWEIVSVHFGVTADEAPDTLRTSPWQPLELLCSLSRLLYTCGCSSSTRHGTSRHSSWELSWKSLDTSSVCSQAFPIHTQSYASTLITYPFAAEYTLIMYVTAVLRRAILLHRRGTRVLQRRDLPYPLRTCRLLRQRVRYPPSKDNPEHLHYQ